MQLWKSFGRLLPGGFCHLVTAFSIFPDESLGCAHLGGVRPRKARVLLVLFLGQYYFVFVIW